MHDHAHHAIALTGLLPVCLAMFMTGLAGGFGHCAGMCGPFVLAQVTGGIAAQPKGAAVMRRLRGGLLLPYHLGRITTYSLLGALAGGLSGMVVRATGFRWILLAFLLLAVLLFLAQALAGLSRWLPVPGVFKSVGGMGWAQALGLRLSRPLRPLFAAPTGINGYVLGLALGFLPCGFLYAALASAVGMGGAAEGALVMASFALGTIPSLATVGLVGSVAGARFVGAMKAVTPALMLFNAVAVGTMGWHLLA